MRKNHQNRGTHNRQSQTPFIVLVIVIVFWSAAGVVTGLWLAKIWDKDELAVEQKLADSMVLTINNVQYDQVGRAPFLVPAGMKLVIIDITLKNDSTQEFNFAPVLQTFLSDSQGNQFEMSPTSLENPISAGKLSSTQEVTGSLSYLVPVDQTELYLNFTPGDNEPLIRKAL